MKRASDECRVSLLSRVLSVIPARGHACNHRAFEILRLSWATKRDIPHVPPKETNKQKRNKHEQTKRILV